MRSRAGEQSDGGSVQQTAGQEDPAVEPDGVRVLGRVPARVDGSVWAMQPSSVAG
jgi:hypothetical protein